MTKSTGVQADPQFRRERASKGGKAKHSLDAYVRAVVARAPELTAEHRGQLAELLQPYARPAKDASQRAS